MVASTAQRALSYVDPPPRMSCRMAFADLVSSKDLYSGLPQNLADYDPDKLKIVSSTINPVDLKRRLPPDVAGLVVDHAS